MMANTPQDTTSMAICQPQAEDLGVLLPATEAADRMSRVCSVPVISATDSHHSSLATKPCRSSMGNIGARTTMVPSFTTVEMFASLQEESNKSSHPTFPNIEWTSEKRDLNMLQKPNSQELQQPSQSKIKGQRVGGLADDHQLDRHHPESPSTMPLR